MTATLHEPVRTFADVWARLGSVPLERILSEPAPGTATKDDVVRLHDVEKRLVELIDGVLVEKPMGYLESTVAIFLGRVIGDFVESQDLGMVAGEAGMMQIAPGLVRIPDLSVVLWHRLAAHRPPTEPAPDLVPDLAIEVLSKTNTAPEMARKVGEYFAAGAQAVWIVDPAARTVTLYSSPVDRQILAGSALVTAETVLPGFHIPVDEIFRRVGL